MTTDTSASPDQLASVVQAARDAATEESVTGIFFISLFFSLAGLAIAYVYKPYAPSGQLMRLGDAHLRSIFENVYGSTFRKRRIKAAWFGIAVAFGLGLFIWIFMVVVMGIFSGALMDM